MFPDESIAFLDSLSCSNLTSLKKTILTEHYSLAFGAGVSASVGLPTWNTFLKKICCAFFYHWVFDVSHERKRVSFDNPPDNMSIAFASAYDQYIAYKKGFGNNPFFDESFDDIEIFDGDKKLSVEKTRAFIKRIRRNSKLTEELQADFLDTIMSRDQLLIAQMIKNRIRPKDWDYLLRKSLYGSYEYKPFRLTLSPLYEILCGLANNNRVNCIINYNYDDTFYHALRTYGVHYQNLYEGKKAIPDVPRIYYPHGFMPMLGGVRTEIVLAEHDYQKHGLQIDLWANNVQIGTFSLSSTVFIGLSLTDSNLRRILNQCRNSSSHIHYAFLPRSGETPTDRMIDSLQNADLYRLGIKAIRYPINRKSPDLHVNLLHSLKFLLSQ